MYSKFSLFSLSEQVHDAEQYFSILSSSPPCPRSQVGFALVLSFIEKLSTTNIPLCELILELLDDIIIQSNDENRHFLVELGLTQVLFNTLSSAISTSQEKIISCVQQCFNSLVVTMFTTTINDDISFISIINNIIGMMMVNYETEDQGNHLFFSEKFSGKNSCPWRDSNSRPISGTRLFNYI